MIYKLSDLCDYVKEKIDVKELTRKNYISTENMLPNKRGISIASSIPSILQTQAFKKGDILISNIRPYFKKIWYAEYDGGCSNDVLVLRAKKGVNKQYLYYLLADDRFFDYAMAFSKGTKMPRGDKTAIMNYSVISFSNEKQDNIAEILNVLDKKIFINDKINRNLSEQASAYYKNWKMSLTGEAVELSKVIDVRDGTHASPKPQDEGYPLVTSKHLFEFDVDLESPNKISQDDYDKTNERSKVEYHDVLMSMIGTVGVVSFISRQEINFAIKNVALFRTSQREELAYYVLLFLKSKDTKQYIKSCMAGSTQQYISLTELRKIPIIVPGEEIKEFNLVIKPIIDMICANVIENRRLSELRDTLLPKLMSGELDVSNLDI